MNTVLVLAVAAAATGGMTEDPPQLRKALSYYTYRVDRTPDINQHMTWEQMLGQIPMRLRKKYTPPAEIGVKSRVFYKNFCGPCAVADNLLYLRKDFPQIGDHANSVVSGTFLARNLGSNYFDTLTNPSDEDFDPVVGGGTSVKNIVKGTLEYLKEKNIPVKNVTVISVWAPTDQRAEYGHPGTLIKLYQRPPTTKEMQDALRKRSIVVSHYGSYEYRPNPTRAGGAKRIGSYLLRTGGHYVAPVGYGKDKNGVAKANMFIIHDPAGSSQAKKAQVYTEWIRQPKGRYQNLRMLNERDTPRHPSYNFPLKPGYELLGSLNQTYVMDKMISSPKRGDRVRVLESLIVIEL